MTVWVVHGHTESYDPVGPYVFAEFPTKEYLDGFMRYQYPEEFEYVGFVHYRVSEVEIIDRVI